MDLLGSRSPRALHSRMQALEVAAIRIDCQHEANGLNQPERLQGQHMSQRISAPTTPTSTVVIVGRLCVFVLFFLCFFSENLKSPAPSDSMDVLRSVHLPTTLSLLPVIERFALRNVAPIEPRSLAVVTRSPLSLSMIVTAKSPPICDTSTHRQWSSACSPTLSA